MSMRYDHGSNTVWLVYASVGTYQTEVRLSRVLLSGLPGLPAARFAILISSTTFPKILQKLRVVYVVRVAYQY